MLQLAPARDGMNRSPCLLGEDNGELVGVRFRITSVAFCLRRIKEVILNLSIMTSSKTCFDLINS